MKKFWLFITKNNAVGAFLICVLVASVMRLYLTTEPTGTIKFTVPLQLINQPLNLAIKGQIERTVVFSVNGEKKKLEKMSAKDFQPVVDLQEASVGENTYPIVYRMPKMNPKDFDIRYEPSRLRITFEPIIIKTLPIKLRAGGKPHAKYKWDYRLIPRQVKLRGPRSLLANRKQIPTREVSLKNRKASFSRSVKLQIPDGVDTNITNNTVTLQVVIQKKPSEISFLGIPVIIRNLKPGFKIQKKDGFSADVTIHAAPAVITRIQKKDVTVTADLGAVSKTGTYPVSLKLSVPADVNQAVCKPETVQIAVVRKGLFD